MIHEPVLIEALAEFLPRQRWFGAKGKGPVRVAVGETEVLREPWPALVRVEAEAAGGRYNVLVGVRPVGDVAPFLEGNAVAVLGELKTEAGDAYGYDAVHDPVLAHALLAHVAPDAGPTERVRVAGVEQTNTSLIYDDRLFLKLFRRIEDGPNPEAEVLRGLASVGFTRVATPLASWTRHGADLAVLQEFLAGGVEGWALALTSLRDLLGHQDDPSMVGGDFSAEARRLGQVTAELHAALGQAFSIRPGDEGTWADLMDAQLARVHHRDFDRDAVRARLERLRWVEDPGPTIRVHGDYHLGQVMRTDNGWYVLDFEGEPARPLEERRRPSSPLKDVAGILRSLHYASETAVRNYDQPDQAERLGMLAAAWEGRNRRAFLDGYCETAQPAGLLPADDASVTTVLGAFELDKAVYELAYEQSHRPDWVGIPLAAIRRLLEGSEV